MQDVYHLATAPALLLDTSQYLTGITLSGLDLSRLAKHNVIEHDASLGHDDANGSVWAPTAPNVTKIEAFIAENPEGITLQSFSKTRVQIESTYEGGPPLDFLHARIAKGECALAWFTLKDENGVVSGEDFRTWFAGERLPDGYERATEELTFARIGAVSREIQGLMTEITGLSEAKSTEEL